MVTTTQSFDLQQPLLGPPNLSAKLGLFVFEPEGDALDGEGDIHLGLEELEDDPAIDELCAVEGIGGGVEQDDPGVGWGKLRAEAALLQLHQRPALAPLEDVLIAYNPVPQLLVVEPGSVLESHQLHEVERTAVEVHLRLGNDPEFARNHHDHEVPALVLEVVLAKIYYSSIHSDQFPQEVPGRALREGVEEGGAGVLLGQADLHLAQLLLYHPQVVLDPVLLHEEDAEVAHIPEPHPLLQAQTDQHPQEVVVSLWLGQLYAGRPPLGYESDLLVVLELEENLGVVDVHFLRDALERG